MDKEEEGEKEEEVVLMVLMFWCPIIRSGGVW